MAPPSNEPLSTSTPPSAADVARRAARIRLLLFDVDGVLTDGRVLLHADGMESKQFFIRDGTAIVLAREAGLLTGFLSARSSASTLVRAEQLKVPIVRQGVHDKLSGYEEILRDQSLQHAEVAFMGDDLLDLPVLGRVGLACAPADAVDEVRARVHWTSRHAGGAGCVRELVEIVLRAQDRWQHAIDAYLAPEEAR